MSLRRRLEALEKGKAGDDPIILHMQDGRTEMLPGGSDYMLDLFTRACRGDRTPEMALIAQCVSASEPGGAHMIDLARAFLNGPAGVREPMKI